MLTGRFEDIDAIHILRLIEDKIAERKTLEYKEKLSIGTGDDKAEFLSDISSFANASVVTSFLGFPMSGMMVERPQVFHVG